MYGDSSPAPLQPKACRDPVLVSRSVEHQTHLKRLGAKMASEFTRSPRCQGLRSIDPSMPLRNFRKATQDLPWGQASLLIQLRTGHILLQKYLHKSARSTPPHAQPAAYMTRQYTITCSHAQPTEHKEEN